MYLGDRNPGEQSKDYMMTSSTGDGNETAEQDSGSEFVEAFEAITVAKQEEKEDLVKVRDLIVEYGKILWQKEEYAKISWEKEKR